MTYLLAPLFLWGAPVVPTARGRTVTSWLQLLVWALPVFQGPC